MRTRLYPLGILVFSMVAMFVFAGCQPSPGVTILGKGTGGGSLAKEGGGIAHFAFNGDSCNSTGTVKGKFNYHDKLLASVDDDVKANGDITSIVQCTDPAGCFDATFGTCPTNGYIVTFSYNSTNPKNRGSGTGGACLLDGGEGQAAPDDQAAVGFDDGPFAGYSAQGTVNGNVQGHLCD